MEERMSEVPAAATDTPKNHDSIAPPYPQETMPYIIYGPVVDMIDFWCIDDDKQGVTVMRRPFFTRRDAPEGVYFYIKSGIEMIMASMFVDHPLGVLFSSESRAREYALGLIKYRIGQLVIQRERNLDALCAIHT